MGREIRRVPPNWEHPKDDKGDFLGWEDVSEYGVSNFIEGGLILLVCLKLPRTPVYWL